MAMLLVKENELDPVEDLPGMWEGRQLLKRLASWSGKEAAALGASGDFWMRPAEGARKPSGAQEVARS